MAGRPRQALAFVIMSVSSCFRDGLTSSRCLARNARTLLSARDHLLHVSKASRRASLDAGDRRAALPAIFYTSH